MRLLAEKVRLHSAKETLIPFRDPLLIGGRRSVFLTARTVKIISQSR